MEERLSTVLLEQKLLSPQQLKGAITYAKEKKVSLEEGLIFLEILTEEALCRIMEKATDLPFLNLKEKKPSVEALNLIPREIAHRTSMLPILVEESKIHVVVCNPFDKEAIQEIEFISKKQVKIYIGLRSQILSGIEYYYDQKIVENAVEELERSFKKERHEREIGEKINILDAPAVKIVNSIIAQAIFMKASDIHMEPFGTIAMIRFRIDGTLREIKRIPRDIYNSICSRIKIIAKMDISEKRLPQDGKFEWKEEKRIYDFRVSTLSTIYGEKIVIRILNKTEEIVKLESLGFQLGEEENFSETLLYGKGIILVTGPTGSGKSTTLYSMLNVLNHEEKNIITIEEPVERTIFGVNQINISPKLQLTFSSILRNVLRQDPDVIMIGEIRDEETAKIAIRAAITGHQVFATLHTNDALSSIYRLIDMGIPRYLLADALIGVMAQRLVRKICSFCKEEYIPTEKEKRILEIPKGSKLFRGRGCSKCNSTGYMGRTVVYEWIYLNSIHKKIIEEGGGLEELRAYSVSSGVKTMREYCKSLIYKGETTFEEFKHIAL